MKTLALALSALALTASHALAADVSGNGALALAAIVAQYGPLPPAEKKVLAGFLEGSLGYSAKKGTIKVSAESIQCRTSNIAIADHSCDLKFGARTHTLNGRKAHELYATLAEVGIAENVGAGSVLRSLSKLACEINPAEVSQKDGSGANCKFTSEG
jgi:hypothetical protein